jgi:hypothetical protein
MKLSVLTVDCKLIRDYLIEILYKHLSGEMYITARKYIGKDVISKYNLLWFFKLLLLLLTEGTRSQQ